MSVCWDTVTAILKAARCTYRRARRVPPKTPPLALHQARARALAKFHRLETNGQCDVLYGDESGFSLCPTWPYAWQAPGHSLRLPAHPHQKRCNVLGFWRRDNWRRPTVLVLDNARIHHAKLVQAQAAPWQARGLRLFFLPPYSPHLNRIEVLWRQIKYYWLEPTAYRDFPSLTQAVTSILDQVGDKYRLSFS